MGTTTKRKTSLSLDTEALENARRLGINVSAVAETALLEAIAKESRRQWLDENADAFAAQAEWHEKNGHPLASILMYPGATSWKT